MALYNYVSTQGVIVPDTSTLRDDVVNEFRQALGDDIITTSDTPEGLLIDAETAARDSVVRFNASVANQINPNVAGGVFIDAIWALMGGERSQTTASRALVSLTGVAGSPITTAVQFRSTSGEVWQVAQATVLDSSGLATAEVYCLTPGPVAAPSSSITQIVAGAIGLESVTNPTAAILGTLSQSDLSARRQRRRELGRQGVGLPASNMAAVYAVDNVRSLTFRENRLSTTEVIDGVTMSPHSIYFCVDGGTDEDVAQAIVGKKGLGANYNGAVEVIVVDVSSGQPYPVLFDRPEIQDVLIRVTVRVANVLINPQTAVRNAILMYVAGEMEGEEGFVVGGSVSPFELASAVNRLEPGIFISKVEVSAAVGGSFSTDTFPIAIDEIARTTESAITVVTTA